MSKQLLHNGKPFDEQKISATIVGGYQKRPYSMAALVLAICIAVAATVGFVLYSKSLFMDLLFVVIGFLNVYPPVYLLSKGIYVNGKVEKSQPTKRLSEEEVLQEAIRNTKRAGNES